MILKGIVIYETQRGKRLVDAHFAVAMKEVNQFVNYIKLIVTTPGDFVTEFQHRGGIANSTAQLVEIDREHVSMMQCTEGDKAGKLAALRRVKEIVFKASGQRAYRPVSLEYSGGNGTS